jgi:thiol-disulfide isomerase/thioredoxin
MPSSPGRPPRTLRAFALLTVLVALLRAPGPPAPSHGPGSPRATSPGLHVLMINGGGSPGGNYQSHYLHLRQLLRLLRRSGVRPDDVAVFSGDGDDPKPDMTVREAKRDRDFALLEGTRLESALVLPTTLVDTKLPGVHLEPATQEKISQWFDEMKGRWRPGDTLLVYVTDHGSKNAADLTDNNITLWGKKEALSVHELRTLLETVDPGVRVVALMSQCYSGAFAHIIEAHAGDGPPRGGVCGYFSSTAERPAYGCYPENRGKRNVGHSVRFIEALAATGSFPAAHDHVLVADATPDVPLRSSDVYVEGLLRDAAKERQVELPALVDEQLAQAWQDRGAWEPQIRLLDRIGSAYGFFSPRSLTELDEQHKRLAAVADPLDTYAKAWKAASADLTTANLARFLVTTPDWRARTDEKTIAGIEPEAARGLAEQLMAALEPTTNRDPAMRARLKVLQKKSQVSTATSYRMDVREAVMLRMRTVLTTLAGQVYLAGHGSAEQRAAYAALRSCEDFHLPVPTPAPTVAARPASYPPYDDDVKVARALLPAWIGIQFKQLTEEKRRTYDFPEGASMVVTVYPNSPAEKAGLLGGDILLGPPRHPFTEPGQIREWTMLSKPDEPRRLVVLRGTQRREVTLVPKPFPGKWPELAGPPKIGSVAPAVELVSYRGDLPKAFAGGTPHLLFFWATWCAPCKASLPEVLAFEQERNTPVIAITDEARTQLDAFFGKFEHPFPATVAIDEYRRAFVDYGVSGTPTFVLVDGDGRVQNYANGYNAEKGLGIPGWTWAGRPAEPAAPPPEAKE